MFIKRSGTFFLKARTLFSLILFLIPLYYFSYSLVIVIFLSTHSRGYILDWYRAQWPDAFDAETIAATCFTSDWEAWISAHHLLLMIMIVSAMLVYLFFAKKVLRFLDGLYSEITQGMAFLIRTFLDCSTREKLLLGGLFALIGIYRIYFFMAYPMLPDETCSYLYFAKQGALITTCIYPFPNNHVGFNLGSSLLSHVSFLSPALVMRLPSMLADFFLCWSIFALFKRFSSFGRAFVMIAGTAFCYLI